MSIKDTIARSKAQKTTEPATGTEDLATELANARRELAEERAKTAATLDAATKTALDWESKAKAAQAQLVSEKIRRELTNAAVAHKALDPDDVVELVIGKGARLDEKTGRVVFGEGETVKDAGAFVGEWIAKKPHLVQANAVAVGSGSNTTPAVSAPASAAKIKIDTSTPQGVADGYNSMVQSKLNAPPAAPKQSA